MAFVNREAELDALRGWWAKDRPRPALLWGRRRVGKTALLHEFARGLPAIFHTGSGQPERGELAELSRTVAAVAPHPLRDLATDHYRDWREALVDIAGRVAIDNPFLLVLDEFPEIVAGSPHLPGILRAFLDQAQGNTQLRILLCGSAVRHMEASMEYRAPLYGRFDLTLRLHPFTPVEAARLLPDCSPEERAVAYNILGGMPLYLQWWDQKAAVAENLAGIVCRPGAPLLTEGRLILATETDRGELPSMVLHAIASGRTRHNEIRDWVGADPTRALDRLVEGRMIERLFPVTETEASRRKIYRITDQLLDFYLRLVSRYLPEIERGMGATILPTLLSSLDDHFGASWEAAFRDHLRRMAIAGQLGPDVVAVGPFWTSDGQNEIDGLVLAGRSRRPAFAGEAKWAKSVNGARLVAGLQRKVEAVPGDTSDVSFIVCAREQVTNVPDGTLVVTATDIFTS